MHEPAGFLTFWHTGTADDAGEFRAMGCAVAVDPLDVDTFTRWDLKGAVFGFNLDIGRCGGTFWQACQTCANRWRS